MWHTAFDNCAIVLQQYSSAMWPTRELHVKARYWFICVSGDDSTCVLVCIYACPFSGLWLYIWPCQSDRMCAHGDVEVTTVNSVSNVMWFSTLCKSHGDRPVRRMLTIHIRVDNKLLLVIRRERIQHHNLSDKRALTGQRKRAAVTRWNVSPSLSKSRME